MAKYVPDIKTQRWIVIAPGRMDRPDDHKKDQTLSSPSQKIDPFAPGNENLTPPEVFRIGEGAANNPGWKVRVVPNKFPITDIHEVIIHSPDGEKDFEDLSVDHGELIFKAYRARSQAHRENGHVLIFCNHGEHAGASLTHPHSQLVVLPKQINLDVLIREPVNNIVEESEHFSVYCPDFSQWPFETWIVPKQVDTFFADIDEDETKELARLLKTTICRLKTCSELPGVKKLRGHMPFCYNFYIFHDRNWYLRIIPRFLHRAGFELGTGLSVNMVDPEDAARMLKEIKEC